MPEREWDGPKSILARLQQLCNKRFRIAFPKASLSEKTVGEEAFRKKQKVYDE
jgi:hypothetical protein